MPGGELKKMAHTEATMAAILVLFLAASVRFAGAAVATDTFGPLVKATVGEVWPKPQQQTKYDGYMVLRPSNFSFKVSHQSCALMEQALERYAGYIARHVTQHPTSGRPRPAPSWESDPLFAGYLDSLDVQLTGSCADYPHIQMLESYDLYVNSPNHTQTAVLSSHDAWGILRGLETFSQILYLDPRGSVLRVNSTSVSDYPRFSHRGLLLDTARHYMPLGTIKTIIDGLEINKMNVFHWHIVDYQSFPYQSKVFPNLSEKGAYDPERLIYTHDDVRNITEYARLRGIRVIPEFDTPGHTYSWEPGQPHLLTPCYSDGELDGTYGPVNPALNSTYTFIRTLFQEVTELFPDQYIHLGGDEVSFDCWQSNADISRFMSENGITSYAMLEQYYMQKVVNITSDLHARSIVWQEVFDNGVSLPANTVVQVWTGDQESELMNITAAGHPAILSACWYLGRLESGGDWTKYYECEPTDFGGTEHQQRLVLGGEACMWAEVVDETNVVSRVWPRASAAAEKLWSVADADTEQGAAERLEEHYCRMRRRGVAAQPPNGPGYCR